MFLFGKINTYLMTETKQKIMRKNFALLHKEVIKPGYCTTCGGCEAVCPVNSISIVNNIPKLDYTCISCGACVDICLRYNQRLQNKKQEKEDLGKILAVYTGRTKDPSIQNVAQNGGIVSTLLTIALKKDLVNSMLLTKKGKDKLEPVPFIAYQDHEILNAASSIYTLNPLLKKVTHFRNDDIRSSVVVGLPCHIETCTYIIEHDYMKAKEKVAYKIGLFCMSSYKDEEFRKIAEKELQVKANIISKTDCGRGKFFFTVNNEIKEVKIKQFAEGKPDGCKHCLDFSADYADIAVGNIGVDDTENVVLIRTEKGKELFKAALDSDLLDMKIIPVDKWDEVLEKAKKLTILKRDTAKKLPPLE